LLLLFIHQLLVLHLRQRMLQRMLPRLRHARHIFAWYCCRRPLNRARIGVTLESAH
jgi:hypothetical protein